VAAIRPAAAVFREEQNFDWRVYAVFALGEIATCVGLVWSSDGASRVYWGVPFPLLVIAGLLLVGVLVLGVLRMTTEVTPTDVRVWFGWIPLYRRAVSVTSIRRLEVVSFRPIADHAGWGIRMGRDGERVLTARGNRGVRIELSDGTRLLIGSQRPEDLAIALERAMGRTV
jgi:hypothetical protein